MICLDQNQADRIANVALIDAKHRHGRHFQAKLFRILSEHISDHELGYPRRVASKIGAACYGWPPSAARMIAKGFNARITLVIL
jgi:hypothetical protein